METERHRKNTLSKQRLSLETRLSDIQELHDTEFRHNLLSEAYNRKLRQELDQWQKKLRSEVKVSEALSISNKDLYKRAEEQAPTFNFSGEKLLNNNPRRDNSRIQHYKDYRTPDGKRKRG